MSLREIEEKLKEVKSCKHEFGEPKTIERGFMIWKWKIRTSEQHYSFCKKCGVTKHEEDGDLFLIIGDKYIELNKETRKS